MKKDRISARQRVNRLLSETTGLVTLDDVQTLFGLPRGQARTLLWRLTQKGWLRQLRPGLYRAVPLELPEGSLTDENPWLVAHALFAPCYMGGWTAASFWGLTDQLFLKTWVMTTRSVYRKERSVGSHDYVLKSVKEVDFFGTTTEWIENNKILVSDPHKTILDFLSFPNAFTASSMIDMVQSYLASDLKDTDLLTRYVERTGNRSALKRLGFILTLLSAEETVLIEACQQRISTGYSCLSTQVPCTKIVRRWNLRVPDILQEFAERD